MKEKWTRAKAALKEFFLVSIPRGFRARWYYLLVVLGVIVCVASGAGDALVPALPEPPHPAIEMIAAAPATHVSTRLPHCMVSSLYPCVSVYLCLLPLRQCICHICNAYDQCLMRALCKLMCIWAQNTCTIAIPSCCRFHIAATGSVFLAYPTL